MEPHRARCGAKVSIMNEDVEEWYVTDIGAICRAQPMDPGPPCALVLVTAVDESTQSVAVTLLSPDMELGGSADIVITREDSGLAYELLAESDVFGYVWRVQLDRVLGCVDQQVVDAISALRQDDWVGRPVAGPPILERSDPRWSFKLSELERLQALTAHCSRQLVDGGP